jgi:hypothetical protein
MVVKVAFVPVYSFLAIIFLLLCSCANFSLPPNEPTDNRPRSVPGSGDEEASVIFDSALSCGIGRA